MISRPKARAEGPAAVEACPVTRFLDVMGGKWKPLIVFHISQGVDRFGALQRAIPQISKQMLTSQLRELEADGVLHREVYAVVPPRVEYSLTPLGETVLPIMNQMRRWGEQHPSRRGS